MADFKTVRATGSTANAAYLSPNAPGWLPVRYSFTMRPNLIMDRHIRAGITQVDNWALDFRADETLGGEFTGYLFQPRGDIDLYTAKVEAESRGSWRAGNICSLLWNVGPRQ